MVWKILHRMMNAKITKNFNNTLQLLWFWLHNTCLCVKFKLLPQNCTAWSSYSNFMFNKMLKAILLYINWKNFRRKLHSISIILFYVVEILSFSFWKWILLVKGWQYSKSCHLNFLKKIVWIRFNKFKVVLNFLKIYF